MFSRLIIYLAGVFVIVLVSACSSHIPPDIKQPLGGSPDISQVRHQVDSYLSQKVRWGGIILHTENKHSASKLTILALPLSGNGKPQRYNKSNDKSPGRFIAIIDEFLEPTVYRSERKITITGRVLRTETANVGEFPYEYPVIQIEHYYLWPVEKELSYNDFPSYPWIYGPYYPFHHSFHHPHHRHH